MISWITYNIIRILKVFLVEEMQRIADYSFQSNSEAFSFLYILNVM